MEGAIKHEIGSIPTSLGTEPLEAANLAAIAKGIGDLDDLVRLLAQGLSRTKPWQRQLDTRLTEVQRLLQVLRLTVAMERHTAEILQAAEFLGAECGAIVLAIAGSRADGHTKAAVHLVSRLAAQLRVELGASRSLDLRA